MTYDFLIIGGGIAGISAAAQLSELGSVCLLEGEDSLGYHATSRSAAMFIAGYGNAVIRALNGASAQHHRTVGGTGVLSPRGLMTLARAGEEDGFLADNEALMMERISLDDARSIFPIFNPETTVQVSYRQDAPDLDTDLLLQGYLRQARANGTEVVCRARVERITKDNGWQVVAGAQTYGARVLVNAAGAWVDEVAKLAGVTPLGFQPYRRSMARVPAPGGLDISAWPMVHGVSDRWYAKPDAGKFIISPSEEDPVSPHDAWADDMVLAEGIARYQEMVTPEVTRLETSWAGLRTFAPDRSLVVGFDARVRDFFWLGGQGGYGFQTAPAVADLVGELAGGRAVTLDRDTVSALDPKRFD